MPPHGPAGLSINGCQLVGRRLPIGGERRSLLPLHVPKGCERQMLPGERCDVRPQLARQPDGRGGIIREAGAQFHNGADEFDAFRRPQWSASRRYN